ncbi:MAG: DUF2752 domain-containing protein [Chthoniobacterales bacterium]
MRVEFRELRAGELDHELIWLAVTVGAALLGVIWLALNLPRPTCAFRSLTGLPCMTCGATRASLSFFHGHLGAALHFNPLVFVGLCAIALFDVYAAIVLTARTRRVRMSFPKRGTRKVVLACVLLVGAGNWFYLLLRAS